MGLRGAWLLLVSTRAVAAFVTSDLSASLSRVQRGRSLIAQNGWIRNVDQISGATYYVNEQTGESRWELSQVAQPQSGARELAVCSEHVGVEGSRLLDRKPTTLLTQPDKSSLTTHFHAALSKSVAPVLQETPTPSGPQLYVGLSCES